MTTSIRILTSGALDSDPSLLLVSPNGAKTLINCGEGTQRAFLEASSTGKGVGGLRVRSVNRVCLTHISHDAVGGLPGMILTTADSAEAALSNVASTQKKGTGIAASTVPGNSTSSAPPTQPPANKKRKHSKPMQLEAENSDLPGLDVVGPSGTGSFLHSLRHFMRRDRFKVTVHEGSYDSSQKSSGAIPNDSGQRKKNKKKVGRADESDQEGFVVQSVPLSYTLAQAARSNGSHLGVGSDDDCLGNEGHEPKKARLSSSPLPFPEHERQNTCTREINVASYLFKTPPIPGKFLTDKARELGIPPGPLYGKLKSGSSVTFVDPSTNEERFVKPEEVVATGSAGVAVAVIYCPTLNCLEQLESAAILNDLRRGNKGSKDVVMVALDVMVHLSTPREIFHDERYQAWCRGFGEDVDHISLLSAAGLASHGTKYNATPFHSAALGAMSRSLVHSELFPFPFPDPDVSSSKSEDIETCSTSTDKKRGKKTRKVPTVEAKDTQRIVDEKTIVGRPLMEYVLIPRSKRGINKASILRHGPVAISSSEREKLISAAKDSGAVRLAQKIVSEMSERLQQRFPVNNKPMPGELIFTGTGSAIPCKHRNVTGMYLRMNNSNAILLDVGEGTVGQLFQSWRHTNKTVGDEFACRLKEIKAAWISHPHADHHLGLLRLLTERNVLCGPNDPLVLMAPPSMFRFLSEYADIDASIHGSYIPVDCRDMMHGRNNPLGEKLFSDLGLTGCVSVPVAHCPHSYAIVMKGTSFGKVSYSGDCRPSDRFAEVGRDSDLLIHEATFEDGMEDEAVLKRHCTVGEAVAVARKMGAKQLILTHFSQRYPRIPPLKKESVGGNSLAHGLPVVFAFDFMRLKPTTVELASSLTPALRLLYPDDANAINEEGDGLASSINDAPPMQPAAKDILSVPGIFAVKGVL